MAAVEFEATGDEELYSMFDTEPTFNLTDNENYRKLLQSSNNKNSARISTSTRLGTSSGFQRQNLAISRPGTGIRPITGFRPSSIMAPSTSYRLQSGSPGSGYVEGGINRPMTAVRGAGYTSQGKQLFDPLNQAAQIQSGQTEQSKEESIEEKVRTLENRMMQNIEESIVASCEGKFREGLDKAKEASLKERSLLRLQEQGGLSDSQNIDLTFMVLYNLANQYAQSELYTEALNTYQVITRNRMFSNSNRLKVNMGNIFFRQGHFHKAIKMYRMALDQVPSSQKNFRIKIMHNIGMVFVRMGQYSDAVASLEYIMSEHPDHRSGLHLILCYYALEDKEKMKNAFNLLLDVPLEIDLEDEKYKMTSDDPEEILITDAIRNDDLHKYEQKQKSEAEYCILTAAKLISPVIEYSFSAGYEWCVQAIKNSIFSMLAGDLEINKAVMYLKQRNMPEAIDTLKIFEKESKIAASAATNLSFIYYLLGDYSSGIKYGEQVKEYLDRVRISGYDGNIIGVNYGKMIEWIKHAKYLSRKDFEIFTQSDYDNAIKYGEMVKQSNGYHAGGLVNLGACAMAAGDLTKAREMFESALDWDPSNVEALFNLGLVYKRQGMYSDALECFQRFTGSLSLLPEVLFQQAAMLELLGDSEAAAECYQQLLGIVPTDPGILQRLGALYDHEGDKQQAYHYHYDSYRYYPSNLSVINWLGSYFIELQVVEKAQVYFEKASIMQPLEPKWRLMVAGCHRRTGNLHRALTLYQDIYQKFPENVECLRFLVRLCTDLGLREAAEYSLELKKLERAKEVRERVSSSRPGTGKSALRSGSSLSIRSAGMSPVPEYTSGNGNSVVASNSAPLFHPNNNNNNNNNNTNNSNNNNNNKMSLNRATRLSTLRDSIDSEEGSSQSATVDATYSDPLGPLAARPMTSAGRVLDDDFGDEPIGDDLLPE